MLNFIPFNTRLFDGTISKRINNNSTGYAIPSVENDMISIITPLMIHFAEIYIRGMFKQGHKSFNRTLNTSSP